MSVRQSNYLDASYFLLSYKAKFEKKGLYFIVKCIVGSLSILIVFFFFFFFFSL